MYCDNKEENKGVCGGPVKPEIVFYGERDDPKFLELSNTIGKDCDLLLVMGTTLVGFPFCIYYNWYINPFTP